MPAWNKKSAPMTAIICDDFSKCKSQISNWITDKGIFDAYKPLLLISAGGKPAYLASKDQVTDIKDKVVDKSMLPDEVIQILKKNRMASSCGLPDMKEPKTAGRKADSALDMSEIVENGLTEFLEKELAKYGDDISVDINLSGIDSSGQEPEEDDADSLSDDQVESELSQFDEDAPSEDVLPMTEDPVTASSCSTDVKAEGGGNPLMNDPKNYMVLKLLNEILSEVRSLKK